MTIQQIQEHITKSYDLRQVVNELADYVQANPGSGIGGEAFTGTPGSIPYVGADGSLTENNTNLYWHNSYKGFQIGAGNYPDTNFKLLLFANENRPIGIFIANDSGSSSAYQTVNLAGIVTLNGYPTAFTIGAAARAANSGTVEVIEAGGLALSATHTNGAVSIFAGGVQEVNRIVKVKKDEVDIVVTDGTSNGDLLLVPGFFGLSAYNADDGLNINTDLPTLTLTLSAVEDITGTVATGKIDIKPDLVSVTVGGFTSSFLPNGSFTAWLDAKASTTAAASLRIRTGVAPTSPNDGDVWQDGTDLKIRLNGVTRTVTVT